MDISEFRQMHSELIEFCQLIEDDLKWIYSYMHKGDVEENYNSLEKTTLGALVKKLKVLDNSEGELFISNDDYNFLKQMTEKRNYWCHQCYLELYDDNERNRVCERLVKDYNRLEIVQRNVYDATKRAMEIYKR